MSKKTLSANVVDLIQGKIFPAMVSITDGIISSIDPLDAGTLEGYLLPGFIDAHIHIESSMLVPSEFARLAVPHGTVATVSDPHEIGNVLGVEGVRFMIQNGSLVPFHFYFGAPSCVPATAFETAGAAITSDDIRELFRKESLHYLSEMMNYPGVLAKDPLVMEKIKIAQELRLPVDGHAPGLRGEDARRYIEAGITTDHECFSLDEAKDKLRFGMKILIREGSAAKNFNALHPLIKEYPRNVMFCSDDKHPNDLVKGHINEQVKRSIRELGYDIMDTLRAACCNPVKHYNLKVGLLQINDPADCIVVDNLEDLNVLQTYIHGQLVADRGKTLIKSRPGKAPNRFSTSPKVKEEFTVPAKGGKLHVIEAFDGELITGKRILKPAIAGRTIVSDLENDILKLAVVNRYHDAKVSVAFVKGFGLKTGAIASCIAHDSHNIIAVGTNDDEICQAVNGIIESRGGISVVHSGSVEVLPLPVAGIMSLEDGYEVAKKYSYLDSRAKELGTPLNAPFMTLSFMALLVIPSLKLSDKGLFDGTAFSFTPLSF